MGGQVNGLVQLNNQLLGAPAGILLAVFAIALGYFLKTLPTFDNKYIPLVVVSLCTLGFMLIAPDRAADLPARIYHTRNFILGFIIGCAAWTFHAQLLRRFIDPKLFPPEPDPTAHKPTMEEFNSGKINQTDKQ